MDEKIRKRFIELKITGQRSVMNQKNNERDSQLIDYLKAIIENKEVTEFEDIGFCYWNISDNYALIKDGYSLMSNHRLFYEHIKSGKRCYLWWLVCDATQRLTLEKDGYSDFWWDLYRVAVEQNLDCTNFFVEFNAHRTALYKNPILTQTQHNLEYAKSNFEKFLQKMKDTPEYQFYKVIYFSLVSRFFSVNKSELKILCDELFSGLSYPQTSSDFLVGEWKSFITPLNTHKRSVIALNSAINAFIYDGDLKTAKEIYTRARNMGLPQNYYIETRLK